MGKGGPVDGMSGLQPGDSAQTLATVSPKEGGRMEP